MNKAELVAKIKPAGQSTAVAESVLDALGSVIRDEISKGGDVTIPGVVKLSVTSKAERSGRNPRTGEAITIPARKAPKVTVLKALKDAAEGK